MSIVIISECSLLIRVFTSFSSTIAGNLLRSLELRELMLSVDSENSENFIHIGNHHFAIFNQLLRSQYYHINCSIDNPLRSFDESLWWYMKASHQSNNKYSTLASLYLGLIHHYYLPDVYSYVDNLQNRCNQSISFDTLDLESRRNRARRYYKQAVSSSHLGVTNIPLDYQLRVLTKLLLYVIELEDRFFAVKWISTTVVDVIKWLRG